MPTDALTATVSPKATKRIIAIVSMSLSFKKFVERRESNPSETRLSRSLSTDALTGFGWRPHASHDVNGKTKCLEK